MLLGMWRCHVWVKGSLLRTTACLGEAKDKQSWKVLHCQCVWSVWNDPNKWSEKVLHFQRVECLEWPPQVEWEGATLPVCVECLEWPPQVEWEGATLPVCVECLEWPPQVEWEGATLPACGVFGMTLNPDPGACFRGWVFKCKFIMSQHRQAARLCDYGAGCKITTSTTSNGAR